MGKTKLLANMVSEIEAAAYRRGFNDGLRTAIKAVKSLRSSKQQSAEPDGSDPDAGPLAPRPRITRRLRQRSDQMRVLEAIRATPGMRGVEILRTLETANTPVHERTLRTALARLKGHGFIEQREDRWYEVQAAGQSN